MAAGTCVAAIVMAAGRLIPRGIPVEKRRIAEYSMLISNGSLIGIPLIQALCGERGVFYANIFMIPTRILAFTAADRYFDADWRWRGFGPGMRRFAANPIVLGMVLGTALNALGIALPDSVLSVCGSISGCMTPLALILVGSTVMDISSVRAAVSLPILLISLFRLVAAPLLTRLVCAVLGLGALETMAAVLVNAAPVASTATIFCKKYGGDAAFTSSSVFVSTLLSFGTLWFIRA